MSHINHPYNPKELQILKLKQLKLRETMVNLLDDFEKDIDKVHKEYVEFQDINQDLRIEIQELEQQVHQLKEENNRLRKDKQELLKEITDTVERLKRRRRLLGDSPESPGESPQGSDPWYNAGPSH